MEKLFPDDKKKSINNKRLFSPRSDSPTNMSAKFDTMQIDDNFKGQQYGELDMSKSMLEK